jgi:[acyl-carrier-protein] S-malonyltransferase
MTLAYIVDGGLNDPPGAGIDLYEGHAAVRRLYAQVSAWTGLSESRLRSWDLPRQQEHRDAGAIRQAAIAIGICDLLAEQGVRPGVIGGVSLGGMVGSCVAGAITREDLFGLLAQLRFAPQPPGPEQAVGTLLAPPDAPIELMTGEQRPGVHLAADLGTVHSTGYRMLLLAGYRSALEELSAELPAGTLRLHEDLAIAYHSPLSQYFADFVRPLVAKIQFRDPEIPLCSYLDRKMVTTGAEVRDLFLRNYIEGVSLPYVFQGLEESDTELAVLLGSAQTEFFVDAVPFPIVQVENAAQLPEVYTAIHELGIELFG